MTNEQIILSNRVFLMNEGVIKGTDDVIEFEGKKIQMPEEIHTFQTWKSLGYSVKKGEHSVARFQIWQAGKIKRKQEEKEEQEDDEEKARKGYYKKIAHFFTKDQVEIMADNRRN